MRGGQILIVSFATTPLPPPEPTELLFCEVEQG